MIKQTYSSLKAALRIAPVMIGYAIGDDDKSEFYYYKSGIFSSKNCGNYIDHLMIAIGYGF
jgi:hypothetical protein